MRPAENFLLLLLGLLVSRQHAMHAGDPPLPLLELLRKPREFHFHWRGGGLLAELARSDLGMLHSSILIVDDGRLAMPLASVQPHLQIANAADASLVHASLAPSFAALAGVEDPDEVYAVYSPVQLAYTADCGFFLPRQEAWHAYLHRALASRLGDAQLELGDSADGVRAVLRVAQTRFDLRVTEREFELEAEGEPAGGLFAALLAFCDQDPMPAGVTARRDARSLRIAGRA